MVRSSPFRRCWDLRAGPKKNNSDGVIVVTSCCRGLGGYHSFQKRYAQERVFLESSVKCGAKGRTQGAGPDSGVQRFWSPLGWSFLGGPHDSTPLFQASRTGSSGDSERCVCFQRSRKRRWVTQRVRGP